MPRFFQPRIQESHQIPLLCDLSKEGPFPCIPHTYLPYERQEKSTWPPSKRHAITPTRALRPATSSATPLSRAPATQEALVALRVIFALRVVIVLTTCTIPIEALARTGRGIRITALVNAWTVSCLVPFYDSIPSSGGVLL